MAEDAAEFRRRDSFFDVLFVRQVHRKTGQGWQQRTSQGWQSEKTKPSQGQKPSQQAVGTSPKSSNKQLNQSYKARQHGQQRSSSYSRSRGGAGRGGRGGGSRGGGGRR